jgi:cation transport protein ChaC
MKPFTRESLSSDEFLESVDIPNGLLWSRGAIEQSLSETLRTRPLGELWVFAYGSLMWNPLLNFEDRQVAILQGWHRSFCLEMLAGRGSLEHPGRMLAVEPGGVTVGVALRLREHHLAEELRVLWTREMLTGAYKPLWTRVLLADGRSVSAITFAADESRVQYKRDSEVGTIAPLMAAAEGALGTNREYVASLAQSLKEVGISDDYIDALHLRLHQAGMRL